MNFIGLLFVLCVAMLIGLALMTHTSYNDVSVVINIVVEPLLCLLIMIPALLSILGIDQVAAIAFTVFKCSTLGLVAIGVICLIYAGYWFFKKAGNLQGFSYSQVFRYSASQWSGIIRQVERLLPTHIYSENFIFTYIRDNLIHFSQRLRMTYMALNLIIYVIAELLSLGLFYLAYTLRDTKIVCFIGGVVFFVISVIPTLHMMVDTLKKRLC